MNNALRTRQRILALVLPLTAALYIGAEGLDPKGTDQIITTSAIAFKVLPIAAKHSTQLYASGSLSELALGAVAVSYAAIAMLARKRGSTTATIAALIGGIGAFCGAIVNVFVGINLAAAASAHVTHQAAAGGSSLRTSTLGQDGRSRTSTRSASSSLRSSWGSLFGAAAPSRVG